MRAQGTAVICSRLGLGTRPLHCTRAKAARFVSAGASHLPQSLVWNPIGPHTEPTKLIPNDSQRLGARNHDRVAQVEGPGLLLDTSMTKAFPLLALVVGQVS